MAVSDAELEHRFYPRPLSLDQSLKADQLAAHLHVSARAIRDATPAGRAQSLALTALEEALGWTLKALVVSDYVTLPAPAEPLGPEPEACPVEIRYELHRIMDYLFRGVSDEEKARPRLVLYATHGGWTLSRLYRAGAYDTEAFRRDADNA